MDRHLVEETPAGGLLFSVDQPLLEAALWRAVQEIPDGRAVLITDRLQASTTPMVIVVPPIPVRCQDALVTIPMHLPVAVLASDELDRIPAVIRVVRDDLTTSTLRVLGLATRAPLLSRRQRALADALLAGEGYDAISERTGLSVRTIKRDVGVLAQRCGTRGRTSFVRIWHELNSEELPARSHQRPETLQWH